MIREGIEIDADVVKAYKSTLLPDPRSLKTAKTHLRSWLH